MQHGNFFYFACVHLEHLIKKNIRKQLQCTYQYTYDRSQFLCPRSIFLSCWTSRHPPSSFFPQVSPIHDPQVSHVSRRGIPGFHIYLSRIIFFCNAGELVHPSTLFWMVMRKQRERRRVADQTFHPTHVRMNQTHDSMSSASWLASRST